MPRRGPRGSKRWPFFARIAEEQGWTADGKALQRRWWAHEKRRMRRRERREGRVIPSGNGDQ